MRHKATLATILFTSCAATFAALHINQVDIPASEDAGSEAPRTEEFRSTSFEVQDCIWWHNTASTSDASATCPADYYLLSGGTNSGANYKWSYQGIGTQSGYNPVTSWVEMENTVASGASQHFTNPNDPVALCCVMN